MAEAKPAIVAKVVALKAHTAFGQSYDVGDAYELDEAFVENVLAQGMARRQDATDAKPKAKKPATPTRKAKIRGTTKKQKRK